MGGAGSGASGTMRDVHAATSCEAASIQADWSLRSAIAVTKDHSFRSGDTGSDPALTHRLGRGPLYEEIWQAMLSAALTEGEGHD